MSNNNERGSLIAAKKLVKQLTIEANVRRIKVSQAAIDLKKYCLQNTHKDPLLMGIPSICVLVNLLFFFLLLVWEG